MKNFQYNPEIHDRQSIRLKGYDYSSPGFYFITICINDGQRYFGNAKNEKMYLSPIGEIAQKCWLGIPEHYPNVILDEFIVMPNHLHGIIEINTGAQNNVGVQNLEPVLLVPEDVSPLQNKYQHIIPKSLGSIIRGYKIGITKWCRQNGHEYFKWHRDFYDHVIRGKDDIGNIRQYIINNPLK